MTDPVKPGGGRPTGDAKPDAASSRPREAKPGDAKPASSATASEAKPGDAKPASSTQTSDAKPKASDATPAASKAAPDASSAKAVPAFKRLFVGARVSVPTANALSGAAETLARRARDAGADIRWVAPVGYHLTLAFLGHTRVEAISAIRDVLDEATRGTATIKIKTARIGAFPSIDNQPRVVWAGIEEPTGELAALAKRLGIGLAKVGYRDDGRPFHAHVTIGRVKELPAKLSSLKEVVLPLSEQMFGDSRIDQIYLFESETKSTGSVYREVHRAAFKTAVLGAPESVQRQTGALPLGAPGELAVERETDDGWPRNEPR